MKVVPEKPLLFNARGLSKVKGLMRRYCGDVTRILVVVYFLLSLMFCKKTELLT